MAVRAVLELAVLAGYAIWGWHAGSGGFGGVALATLFVVAAGAVWSVFRTPGDTGAGGAIVPVAGWLRLLIELVVIGLAAYGVWTSWSRAAAETLLTALAIHYAITWERSWWLLRAPGRRR